MFYKIPLRLNEVRFCTSDNRVSFAGTFETGEVFFHLPYLLLKPPSFPLSRIPHHFYKGIFGLHVDSWTWLTRSLLKHIMLQAIFFFQLVPQTICTWITRYGLEWCLYLEAEQEKGHDITRISESNQPWNFLFSLTCKIKELINLILVWVGFLLISIYVVNHLIWKSRPGLQCWK